MNRRTSARGSSLFLIELIISILFFAVASSVCVQFFVKARLMSREASQLEEAISACTTASETISSGTSLEDISDRLKAIYPDYAVDLTSLLSDTDNAGETQPLSEELTASCSMKDGILTVLLSYTPSSADEAIYTLTVEKYLPGGNGNA